MYRSRYFAVVLLIASVNAQASDNLIDQIQGCSQIDSSEMRLACYDEMAQGVASDEQTSVRSPDSGQPVSGAGTAAGTAAAAAGAAPESAPATPLLSIESTEEQFGFEHKQEAATKEKAERIYVEVSNMKSDRAGLSTIYLENGQVWRQIGTDRYFYNEKQGKAYVERGSLNSFFFSQDEIKRRIRVKRLR
jgi:hypothetical protein